MAISNYFLGLPSWGLKDWVGHLYRPRTPARDFLRQYAEVWNTVEGNTTFYNAPSPETVDRWAELTPEAFRFCFKLPQDITHRAGLAGSATSDTLRFLDRMAPLGPRLGPFMIQLPASFGPDRINVLERFLGTLPSEWDFAVEVRHPAFFAAEWGPQLDALLAHHACERVVMDTRPLRSGDPDHPDVRSARTKKPNLPVHPVALGRHPIVRYIGHPEDDVNTPWLDLWSDIVAGWIQNGLRPFFFAHCPNDFYAPGLARRLHRRLVDRCSLDPLPAWPGEKAGEQPRQLSLFD